MTDRIEGALEELREAIAARLRAEQLQDQLTGLGNDASLTEWLTAKIDADGPFWAAFVEVDKFKDINDEFGYDDADELLRRIADRLRAGCKDYFPSGALAFRAHGDEFFLVGEHDSDDDPGPRLDQLREEVQSIRIQHRDGRALRATVSVGWLTSTESQRTEEGLTPRSVRRHLEMAVAEAKVERNRVVGFSSEMRSHSRRAGRADCAGCHAKFSLTVPAQDDRDGDLACPNCGQTIARPPSLVPRDRETT